MNGPPDAVDDAATTNQEVAVVIPVLGNDSDPEGDEIEVVAVAVRRRRANGTPINNGDGTVTYTPDTGFCGSDSFTYTIADPRGLTDVATVRVDVNCPPDAAADAASVNEGATVTIDVLVNDSDPDAAGSPPLTTGDVSYSDNGDLTEGTLVDNTDGTFDYTAAASASASATFTYTITDPGGLSDTATVTITINRAPNAAADAASVNELTSTTITVLTNDSDPDVGGSPPLTTSDVTVAKTTDPTSGTATLNANGTFTYTNTTSAASDSFTYTITDPGGLTSTATVTITINRAPDAAADAASVNEGATVTIDVLVNDSDPDAAGSPPLTTGDVSYSDNGDLTEGTLVDNTDGTFDYTAAASASASATFTYTITDPGGLTSTATVTITINRAPDAAADAASVNEGATVTIDVLVNDFGSRRGRVATIDDG